MLLWVATFWRYKTFRDHSICGREYSSYANLIGEQRLNKTPVFSVPYCACNFPSPLLNNEAELSRWRFGLNKMIRLLLHISLRGKIWGWNCIVNSSIELRLFNWKRPVELRKIFGLDFIYNVIHGRTVYMISVPLTRISNFFFSDKRIVLS